MLKTYCNGTIEECETCIYWDENEECRSRENIEEVELVELFEEV